MSKQSEPMEVAIISQYFFPDHASTGNLMTDLAVGLSQKGCDVKVYTGYPSYWGRKQKCKKIENHDGVIIHRIFHLNMDTRTKFGSILHGVSFFIFTLLHLIMFGEKRMYLIVTTPPFAPYIGFILKKIRCFRYIVIIHDIDPDISIKIKFIKQGWVTRLWEKGNVLLYNNATKIIVLGKCMADMMCKKQPACQEKITIIQNWEKENFIKPMNKNQNWFALENKFMDKFIVLYSGNMGLNHNLSVFLDSAKYIGDSNIEFIFIGEGTQKKNLIQKSQNLDLKNVKFFDFQPKENLPFVMTSCDIILISQQEGTEGLCVSCKFYTALAAGRPIIATIGENSEIAYVIKKYNCGIVIDNYDPKSIAKSLLKLQSNKELCEILGKNARIAFENNFTYDIAVNKYYDLIKCVDEAQLISRAKEC